MNSRREKSPWERRKRESNPSEEVVKERSTLSLIRAVDELRLHALPRVLVIGPGQPPFRVSDASLKSPRAHRCTGGSMPSRYTIPQLIFDSKETFRQDSIRRRSSGFGYWLLVPFAFLIVYGFIAWLLFLGISDEAEKLRAWLNRLKAHAE